MLAGQTIVLFSAVPWSGLYARPQQLTTRFAQLGARVLFVEPAGSILSPLKNNLRPNSQALKQISQNIAVLTPPLIIPGGYALRLINRINQRWLWQVILRATRRLGWDPTMVWTHLPNTADLPMHGTTVYDCVDDHAAFSALSPLWRREVVIALENALLARATAVFASSEFLLERCRTLRPETQFIGNGVAVEHFLPAASGPTGSLGLPSPVIGFYGGIGPWLDVELVVEVAALRPDYNFVLIGPVENGLRLPAIPKNVHLLGFLPYVELPPLLADFDVALIPFRRNEITQSVNPLKLYEYFAAGKPVIVADIPELTRWKPLVYAASTPLEWVSQIDAALTEPAGLKLTRQQVARDNSWDVKVHTIVQTLEGLAHA